MVAGAGPATQPRCGGRALTGQVAFSAFVKLATSQMPSSDGGEDGSVPPHGVAQQRGTPPAPSGGGVVTARQWAQRMASTSWSGGASIQRSHPSQSTRSPRRKVPQTAPPQWHSCAAGVGAGAGCDAGIGGLLCAVGLTCAVGGACARASSGTRGNGTLGLELSRPTTGTSST
jgi:hypothetical protein